MKILTYVLHGMWDTPYTDGVVVIGVSVNVEPLLKKLDEIADSKAKEFVDLCGYIQEERGERYYEAVDASGKYGKFYITEHWLEFPESMMGAVSREMEKIDRTSDVEAHIKMLFESESIEAWKYEYMVRKPEVMKEILQLFDKMEDCNVSYNATMEAAAWKVVQEINLDDTKVEFLWEEFGDVLIDDDECILDDFLGFECGTHREVVWHWFDERYSGGVAKLMFGGDGGC